MNDIKNENERLTLPFVPEAVIVGNGDFPSHPFPLAVLDQAPCVVCCDGATNALADSGRGKGGYPQRKETCTGAHL